MDVRNRPECDINRIHIRLADADLDKGSQPWLATGDDIILRGRWHRSPAAA